MAFAPRGGESLRQAAHATPIDEDRRGHRALGVALRRIEASNRGRCPSQFGFTQPRDGQRGPRNISDPLQPLAETVEEEEEFEWIAARMKLPRDHPDPLDLVESRDAIEVLIEWPEERFQPRAEISIHRG